MKNLHSVIFLVKLIKHILIYINTALIKHLMAKFYLLIGFKMQEAISQPSRASSNPIERVELLPVFPDLEVDGAAAAVVFVRRKTAKTLPGPHLIAYLYRRRRYIAVDGIIISMVDYDDGVVAGQNIYARHLAPVDS